MLCNLFRLLVLKKGRLDYMNSQTPFNSDIFHISIGHISFPISRVSGQQRVQRTIRWYDNWWQGRFFLFPLYHIALKNISNVKQSGSLTHNVIHLIINRFNLLVLMLQYRDLRKGIKLLKGFQKPEQTGSIACISIFKHSIKP